MGLFCLCSVLLISSLVFLAGDEVEILHDLESFDSRIFRFELNEIVVLIPFVIQLGITGLTIKVLLMDSPDEAWFYLRQDRNGLKVMRLIVLI
jgi:hypothetical protein